MDLTRNYLKIKPSEQSLDYVENKKQFHLFSLLTEQRHPKTWNLSASIKENTVKGLQMLLSVDEDITLMTRELADEIRLSEQAADAIYRAIKEGRKIYYYGCGSTGRLAKQMESSFWRPFWRKMKKSNLWEKVRDHIPGNIEDYLIGEMTGADRALISSLEGFEDLQLIGSLQLLDRGIEKGDVVFCVTEGGETSSVIGTILKALDQYGELTAEKSEEARRNLYFVYNNPDELLIPFERSRKVIENPAITKLNLTTGPQSITGSTRMQATSSEIFVLGSILEEGLYRFLGNYLSKSELSSIGFSDEITLQKRIASFSAVKESVDKTVASLCSLTEAEAETYSKGRFATYLANEALVTVFIDITERSPTFRLFPLDTIKSRSRKSWIQVWAKGKNTGEAWFNFLGRDFRGLEKSFYERPFRERIDDPYLKEVALKSLENAGNDQKELYDLSFTSRNIENRGPSAGDLGVIVCIDNELDEINDPESEFRKFAGLFREKGGRVAIISVSEERKVKNSKSFIPDIEVEITLPSFPDPITLRKQIALKMLLNAHSTGVMAILGRIIGNTMTTLNPSNLKLIGRATYLIMSHVNDTISQKEWIEKYGYHEPITFNEINAVLFDSINYISGQEAGETAEVPLSIIRILESLKTKDYVSWDDTRKILDKQGLENYLTEHNPNLGSGKQ